MASSNPFHITPDQAAAQLPEPSPEALRFVTMLRRGEMSVELYAPRGRDMQAPHPQDEIYIVIAGEGWFINGEDRHRFGRGDILFVPAGRAHRFEEFSDDFMTWVVFYGPVGGSEGSLA